MKNSQKIPVYFHIPKNAGSYILKQNITCLSEYVKRGVVGKKRPYRFRLVTSHGAEVASVFAASKDDSLLDDEYVTDHPDADGTVNHFVYNCLMGDFFRIVSKGLFVFSVIIQPNPYLRYRDADALVRGIAGLSKRSCTYYTTLREPFDRARSLFHYLGSDKSSHERTHGVHKSKTFIDFLNSRELQDSWEIRFCNNTGYQRDLTEQDYEDTCKIFDQYEIRDIGETDALINQVFGDSYGITLPSADRSNTTAYKEKVPFDSLDEETKKSFLERSMYARKLYERYCG